MEGHQCLGDLSMIDHEVFVWLLFADFLPGAVPEEGYVNTLKR